VAGEVSTANGTSQKDFLGQYFRNTGTKESSQRERGLLSRVKGETSFRSGRGAVDDVYAAFLAGKIPDAKACAIAKAALNNDPAQLATVPKAVALWPSADSFTLTKDSISQ
jgi:hypothetical protein